MFVTSLSVPGQHLKCASKVRSTHVIVGGSDIVFLFSGPWQPRTLILLSLTVLQFILRSCYRVIHPVTVFLLQMYGDTFGKIQRALAIWSGFGMTLAGVQTCGDYMFSGHTVVITMLNFFVTECEYWCSWLTILKPETTSEHSFLILIADTPRSWNLVHTISWVLNLFGIFFILAAHEHYSIDVFIAFYITTRLFLYYHTLANTRAYQQSRRARIWFPMFSFFECNVNGPVPNQYHWPFERPAFMKTLIG